MARWEYKCVALDRKGAKEDFSFTWTYGPWEMALDQGGKKLLPAGLDELGRQGWELAGVLTSDLWSEGARCANASHGVRTISCTLVFKRPATEETQRSPATPSSAATAAPTAVPSTTPPAVAPKPSAPAPAAPPATAASPSTPAAASPPATAPPDTNPPATDPSENPA